jgi:hypothetical protein
MRTGSHDVNSSCTGRPAALSEKVPTACCAIMNATISPCSVLLPSRTTLFIPTPTSFPESRSNMAAPNGPPVPRSTLARESVMARRIRLSSS